MNNSSAIPNHDMPERRWIVVIAEFRTGNEAQRHVIDELGLMAYEVVRLWLIVATPGAVIVGPSGQGERRISFHRRSEMRRFIQLFGGRQLRPSENSDPI